MAGTLTVDTIQSDSSYASTINVASKMNFSGGYQVGGYDSAMMFRNRWFNGKMEIEQRTGQGSANGVAESSGTAGTAKFVNNGTSVVYCVDRMSGYGQTSGVWKMQKSTDVPTGQGFINSLACTVTTTGTMGTSALHFLGNYIEGYNVADWQLGGSSAKPYTVSFWVKSSITGPYALITNSGEGSTNLVCIKHYTINQANTWEYKTVTFTPPVTGGDSQFSKTTGRGIGIWWGLGCGTGQQTSSLNTWIDNGATQSLWGSTTSTQWAANSGATFYITGVQVESGNVATPFEHRPINVELQLCQRYFYPLYNGVNGRNIGTWPATYYEQGGRYVAQTITFPVQMRISPSIVQANVANNTGNQWNWPPSGSLTGATSNFSIWSQNGVGQGITILSTATAGPTGNGVPLAASGAAYMMDFSAANTIVAFSSELQGSV